MYGFEKIKKSRKHYGEPPIWRSKSKNRSINIQEARRNKYNAIDLIVEMEYGKFH